MLSYYYQPLGRDFSGPFPCLADCIRAAEMHAGQSLQLVGGETEETNARAFLAPIAYRTESWAEVIVFSDKRELPITTPNP